MSLAPATTFFYQHTMSGLYSDGFSSSAAGVSVRSPLRMVAEEDRPIGVADGGT